VLTVSRRWRRRETECFKYGLRQRLVRAFSLAQTLSRTACAVTSPVTGGVAPYNETYSYDCNGSVVSDANTSAGTTAAYVWDGLGRLASSTTTTGTSASTTSNVYDATGRRVLRTDTVGTTVTKTIYLGQMEYRWVSTAPTAVKVMRDYGGAQRGFDNTLTWVGSNTQGSVMTMLSTAGVVGRTFYKPYGAMRSGTGLNDKAFLGQTFDANTGLNYLNNRYQDPSSGVFLSVDPLIGGTGRPYDYANNNPVAISDPTGLKPAECEYRPEGCGNTGPKPTPLPNFVVPQVPASQETKAKVEKTNDQFREAVRELCIRLAQPGVSNYWNCCGGFFDALTEPAGELPDNLPWPTIDDGLRIWSDILTGAGVGDPGTTRGASAGVCASVGGSSGVVGASAQGCFMGDTDGLWTTVSAGAGLRVGGGLPGVSASAGGAISNADVPALTGWGLCGSVTTGGVAGSLCGSLFYKPETGRYEYSGAWVAFAGVSTPGAEVQLSYTYTWADSQLMWSDMLPWNWF
jgi:RHS repeat-associated protein